MAARFTAARGRDQPSHQRSDDPDPCRDCAHPALLGRGHRRPTAQRCAHGSGQPGGRRARAGAGHSPGPAVDPEIEIIEGHPTSVLVTVSKRVDLLVVGGRGFGGWKGAFARSLTGHLAGHTSTPLAVIRSYGGQPRGRIVVGVDGLSSSEAVSFGVEEAALRGASVLVVSTWQYPVLGTRPTAVGGSDPWCEWVTRRRCWPRRHDRRTWSWSAPAAAAVSPR